MMEMKSRLRVREKAILAGEADGNNADGGVIVGTECKHVSTVKRGVHNNV